MDKQKQQLMSEVGQIYLFLCTNLRMYNHNVIIQTNPSITLSLGTVIIAMWQLNRASLFSGAA